MPIQVMIMTRQINPYYRSLHTALRRFVLLNGVFFQFSTHVKQRSLEIERFLKRGPKPSPLMAAASLVIRDLTVSRPDGCPETFPIGGHSRQGRHYLRALHDIVARESAWIVVQGFEAFEAFAKDVVAVYLKRNPGEISAPVWVKRRHESAGVAPKTRRVGDYRAFVGAAYGGVDDLIKRLRAAIPELAHAEYHNNRDLDLQAWLSAAAAVRHATVHGRAIVSPSQLQRLGPERSKLLRGCFPGKIVAGAYRLLLDDGSANLAIKLFAEYAFLIFKVASQREGLDYEVFRTVSISV